MQAKTQKIASFAAGRYSNPPAFTIFRLTMPQRYEKKHRTAMDRAASAAHWNGWKRPSLCKNVEAKRDIRIPFSSSSACRPQTTAGTLGCIWPFPFKLLNRGPLRGQRTSTRDLSRNKILPLFRPYTFSHRLGREET